jgi:hypothetical protein
MDYFDTIMRFMSYFTYYPEAISPMGWSLCGPILSIIDLCAIDYMEDSMTPLLNYLTKDIATFMTIQCVVRNFDEEVGWGDHVGPVVSAAGAGYYNSADPNNRNQQTMSSVDMLLRIIKKLYERDDTQREMDSKYASVLLTTMLVCCKSAAATQPQLNNIFDGVLPGVLQVVIERMMRCKTMSLKLKLLDVYMACIYYNATLTLQLLHTFSPDLITKIFTTLFDNLDHIDKDSSERVLVLALKALLFDVKPRNTCLPAIVLSNVVPMFTQMVREVELIEEEAEKEEEEDEEGEDDEDSDDEYDLGGGDDDDDLDFGDFSGDRKFAFDDTDDLEDEEEEDDEEDASAVPEGGYGASEDCVNCEDESYLEYLKKMEARQKSKEAEEAKGGATRKIYRDGEAQFDEGEVADEDEYDYVLPTDNVDILMVLMETIQQNMSVSAQTSAEDVAFMQQLLQSLKPEDTARLNAYATTARERQAAKQQAV